MQGTKGAGLGFREERRQDNLVRNSLSTAARGNDAQMSEDKNRKQDEAAEERTPDGKDEDVPRGDMAFDPVEAALRQLHDRIAAEDIPDDFLRLLDQLDDRSGAE